MSSLEGELYSGSDEVSSLEGELYSGSDGFIPYHAVLQGLTEIGQSLQSGADQYVTSKSDPQEECLEFFLGLSNWA